jgi:hypothetical protein
MNIVKHIENLEKTTPKNGNGKPTIETIESAPEQTPVFKYQFWYVSNEKLVINETNLMDFLFQNGIMRLQIDESNETNTVLIHNQNNVMKMIDMTYVKEFTLNYIKSIPPETMITETHTALELHTIFLKKATTIIKDDNVYALKRKILKINKDGRDFAYKYFKNGYIKIFTADKEIEFYDYSELENPIWESQIINHNIEFYEDNEKLAKFESLSFFKFLKNICTNPITKDFDARRFKQLLIILGYLLHSYNRRDAHYVIILTEAVISDENSGGTGKGILLQAVKCLMKMTIIDGKNHKINNEFAFQTVDLDTKIIFFDDVWKRFSFETLYSIVSENFVINKKYHQPQTIDFENLPKVVIATNYAIENESGSAKRRKREIELMPYYSSEFTPEMEFGEVFFTKDWNNEQWNIFYNIMLDCLQTYLTFEKIENYTTDTMLLKKVLNYTNEKGINYINEYIQLGEEYDKSEVYNEFLDYTDATQKDLSKNRFVLMLKKYCKIKNLEFEEYRKQESMMRNVKFKINKRS